VTVNTPTLTVVHNRSDFETATTVLAFEHRWVLPVRDTLTRYRRHPGDDDNCDVVHAFDVGALAVSSGEWLTVLAAAGAGV
jgi:hypothetical protein